MRRAALPVVLALSVGLLAIAGAWPAAAAAATDRWFWQNPYPQGNSLQAADFAGDTGWAVGQGGAVVRTLSGGAFWANVNTLPGDPTVGYVDLDVVDADHVWIAREDGELLASTDGGASWTSRRPEPSYGTTAVAFFSPNEGWACSRGLLFRTTDGGTSWSWIDHHMCVQAKRLVVHDQELFILTDDSLDGYLLRAQSGDSALEVVGTFQNPVRDISFGDAEHGIGVTAAPYVGPGAFLRTSDGGDSWVETTSSRIGYGTRYNVFMADALTGYALNSVEEVVRTTDGGQSWGPFNPRFFDRSGDRVGAPTIYGCRIAHAPGRVILTGTDGAILSSRDDGLTWRFVSADILDDLVDVNFQSTSSGVALGLNSGLLTTTDGGGTWRQRRVRLDQDADTVVTPEYYGTWQYAAMTVAENGRGWIVGQRHDDAAPHVSGLMLHSVDGMLTFDQQRLPAGVFGLLDVWSNGGRTAWASGTPGVILKTTDGGDHWRKCSISADAFIDNDEWKDIVSIEVRPTGLGYAVGHNNGAAEDVVLRTTDGGETWGVATRVHYPMSVTFEDDTTVWVGGVGQMWTNTYPSDIWTPHVLASDGMGYVGDVAFLTDTIGYATSGHLLYRTDDGGVTWPLAWEGDGWIDALATADGTDAWAVGTTGTVLYNGGLAGDYTPPITRTSAPSGWSNDPVSISLTAADRTGIDGTWWAFGEEVPAPLASESAQVRATETTSDPLQMLPYKRPMRVTAQGITPVTFFSSDGSGNVETPRTVFVRIDTRAPRVTSDCRLTYSERAAVRIAASDGLSGVRAIKYRLDGGKLHAVRQGSKTVVVTVAGRHTITYWATDRATNASRAVIRRFNIQP
jgi:photosystem II stability/assembly factor-like uncharacterized protein